MSLRVLMNMPIGLPRGVDRMVIVDEIPRVGESVMIDNRVYEVSKVLHPVLRRGALNHVLYPVVILHCGREDLTPIEEAHKDSTVSVVPD